MKTPCPQEVTSSKHTSNMLESRGRLSAPARLILGANCWLSGLRPAPWVLFGSHGNRLLSSPGALHRLLPPRSLHRVGNLELMPVESLTQPLSLRGLAPWKLPPPRPFRLYPPAHPALCQSFATALVRGAQPQPAHPLLYCPLPRAPSRPTQPPHTGGPGSMWLTG